MNWISRIPNHCPLQFPIPLPTPIQTGVLVSTCFHKYYENYLHEWSSKKKIGTIKAKSSLLYFTVENGGHLWCYTLGASITTEIRGPAGETKTRWCLSALIQKLHPYLQFPHCPFAITKAVWVEGWQPGNHTALALLFSWSHSTLLWHPSSFPPPLRVH